MDYTDVATARELPGLRLALTRGVPGPWSQAAKFAFEVKGVPYTPVLQIATAANDELYAWTGHRNAPVAVYDDEPPRAGWFEIIQLADRLGAGTGPNLLPQEAADRAAVVSLIAELASEGGLAWQRRLQMIAAMRRAVAASGEEIAAIGDLDGDGLSEILAGAPDGGYALVMSFAEKPDPPALSIHRDGGQVILSWPVELEGWTLEQSTDLHTWSPLEAAPDSRSMSIDPQQFGSGNYFRLVQGSR